MQDTRFMRKLLAIARQPELPLFANTHLPTFRKQQNHGTPEARKS